jgi:phage tail sheath protein FI
VANYNKPGVYVEETLTPNIPVSSSTATTAAAFIGIADRGPTLTSSSGSIVGSPTLITNWSQFNNVFSFAGSPATFDSSIANTLGTASSDLKYAVKSYFDNGGAELYVLRDLNTNATKSSIKLKDNDAILYQADYWTLDGTEANKIKISASNPAVYPFANKGYEVGRIVTLKNLPSPFAVLNEKNWVISDVDPNGNFIKIIYKTGTITASATYPITGITTSTLASSPTVTGASAANTVIIGASTGVAIGQGISGTGIATASTTITSVAAFSTNATPTVGASATTSITVATVAVQVGMTVTAASGIGAGNTVAAVSATGVTLTATTTGPVTGGPMYFNGATLGLSATNTGPVSGTAAVYTGTVTYAISNTTGLFAGNSITVSGATTAGYNGTFTIGSVVATSITTTANYTTNGSTSTATGNLLTPQAASTNAPIVIVGGGQGTNNSIQILANSEGIWGNYLWASVSPNSTENTFDINVFYSLTAVTSADLKISDRVESFQQLSLDTNNSRYITKIINANTSNWITVVDLGIASPVSIAATGTSGQNTLSVTASAITSIVQGMSVTGTNIGANALVISTAGTTVTVSAANTGTVNSTLVFGTPINLHDTPAFTTYWNASTVATNANVLSTTGEFTWNTSGVANGNGTVLSTNVVNAVKIGKLSSDLVTYPTLITLPASNYPTAFRVVADATTGSNGTSAADLTSDTLPRLDAITSPLVFNYPKKYLSTDVNKLLTYAAGRGNAFVVVDPTATATDSVATVLSNMSGYKVNANFGAAYYPYIRITDPASATNGSKDIPASGSVMAVYVNTDTSRGVFKAPAGINAQISNAKSAYSLTNDEFTLVNNNPVNLNIIRPISGNFCIMGARTLNSTTSDKFIPVRRSLNYLGTTLKDATQFAVFEPNDSQLWSKVTSVVNGILYNFWRAGGLAGTTQGQAYYVKCDSDNNTSASIAAGELRIEVGVALQQPAEFVIIRIGQINGGATVTTSV